MYIKKWVPELGKVPVRDILQWDAVWSKYFPNVYVQPIVDHATSARDAKAMLKREPIAIE